MLMLSPVLLLVFAQPWTPDLSGTWFNSGDPRQACYIEVYRDGSALFTNENGDSATGVIHGSRVFIPTWGREENLPGLEGRIQGDRIVWPDGNFWSRRPARWR